MAELTENSNKKCIFVVGPTASGKSSWALKQAEKYRGSIVNIDSIQLYRDLTIGSAAPTAAEKAVVPHLLYSYIEAPREVTAGDYVKDFYRLIKEKLQFPLFIVGGTGFYIQALEKGMFDVAPIPAAFRKTIEDELLNSGAQSLFEELKLKDPDSKIHINDHYRLVRAIEIIRYTGAVPSRLHAPESSNKNEFPFPYLKIGFDAEKNLYETPVAKRTEKMITTGIIDETQSLITRGFSDWAPLQSVGYKETFEY